MITTTGLVMLAVVFIFVIVPLLLTPLSKPLKQQRKEWGEYLYYDEEEDVISLWTFFRTQDDFVPPEKLKTGAIYIGEL
jgi:hypothetical protein